MAQIKIVVLVGLPGSGKTYFADNYPDSQKKIIHFDDYKNDNISLNKIYKKEFHWSFFGTNMTIILDGLFFTQKSRIDAVYELFNHLPKTKTQFIIEFVQWNDDEKSRQKCLLNDSARNREQLATTTIKEAVIEPISLDDFKKGENNIISSKIKKKEVHKTTLYEREFVPFGSWNNKELLKSEEWCLGGTWGDYNGNEGTVGADEPREFDELDELLTRVAPTITFLHYKHIIKNIAKKSERYEHDYYGGSTNYMFWEINLKELYNFLKKNNYITQ